VHILDERLKSDYSIEEVSELANLSSFTLRNWEDRYKLFSPGRDAAGRRMYSEVDALRAYHASELVKKGFKISKIVSDIEAGLSPADLVQRYTIGAKFKETREEALQHLVEYNMLPFRQAYEHMVSHFPLEFLIESFFSPILDEIRSMHARGKITLAQKNFASFQLSSRLHRLIGIMQTNRPYPYMRKAMLAPFPSEKIEADQLVLLLALERQGWDVYYGGVGLPISELVKAADQIKPEVLILSGNEEPPADFQYYLDLLSAIQIPVILIGESARKVLKEEIVLPAHFLATEMQNVELARILRFKVNKPQISGQRKTEAFEEHLE
jgi:DNA-binding transcriptional MerR regulator